LQKFVAWGHPGQILGELLAPSWRKGEGLTADGQRKNNAAGESFVTTSYNVDLQEDWSQELM